MKSQWLADRKEKHAEKQATKRTSSQKRQDWWQNKWDAIRRKRAGKHPAIKD
jgi:hypothetical protein